MYAQRPASQATQPIRKISPKQITTNQDNRPITQENWHHLVNIVMKLAQDKKIKDSVVSDLATRISKMETTMDHGMILSTNRCTDDLAPTSDTFTMRNVPAFLRGRIRRSYALISKQIPSHLTRHSSYRLTFHQYLGVPGLGIGVSRGKSKFRPAQAEEILFLGPAELEVLVKSVAGEKERRLPDLLLKYLHREKRGFVRDWMKGYINLEKDDEDFAFSVNGDRCDEKDIWIEYVGTYDGMGTMLGENMFGFRGKCGERANVTVSRMNVVV